MARKGRGQDQRGRSARGGQFVPIPYLMAHSDAWRSLSGGAVKVYVELRSRFNGKNNGDLSLSYADAAGLLGLSKSTVKRAFDELTAKGFIVRVGRGSWYGRKAATWAVADRQYKGHVPTNAWRIWKRPDKGSEKSAVPDRHAKLGCASPEYREPPSTSRKGTRRGHLRVIDGAK